MPGELFDVRSRGLRLTRPQFDSDLDRKQWFPDKSGVPSASLRRDAIISVICKRGCG